MEDLGEWCELEDLGEWRELEDLGVERELEGRVEREWGELEGRVGRASWRELGALKAI